MKKNYLCTSLSSFLNESKTITLKRKYGETPSVVVGSNAPLRNQVLSYVAENVKVSKNDLRRFIAGLNEGSKNPTVAANMWLARNERFFITESKNGKSFVKLSPIGKKLTSGLTINKPITESSKLLGKKLNEGVKYVPVNVSDEEAEGAVKTSGPDDIFYNYYDLADGRKIAVNQNQEQFLVTIDNSPVTESDSKPFRKKIGGMDDIMDKPRRMRRDDIEDDDIDVRKLRNLRLQDIEDMEREKDSEINPYDEYDDIDNQEEYNEEEFNTPEDFEETDIVRTEMDGRPRETFRQYDFVSRGQKGLFDKLNDVETCKEKCEAAEMSESAKARIKSIVENIKSKESKKLNEAEEEKEKEEEKPVDSTEENTEKKKPAEEDELTFDDLDLDLGDEKEGEDDENTEESKPEGDDKVEGGEETEEKVEITEFIITVGNTDEAISELSEIDVPAEKVMDEEGEEVEGQIKVSAENWDALKGWLEEKNVDIEEMFGGEIEVEGENGENNGEDLNNEKPLEDDLGGEKPTDELGGTEVKDDDLSSLEEKPEDDSLTDDDLGLGNL